MPNSVRPFLCWIGISFAAIQGLYRIVKDKDAAIKEQQERIERLERGNERIANALEKLALQVAAIEGSTKTIALE